MSLSLSSRISLTPTTSPITVSRLPFRHNLNVPTALSELLIKPQNMVMTTSSTAVRM
ncbi:unnamed protein product [Strongylus vulgaris]|uniref:Uncharacterized protein n=1 Tax=Strongylus vulgaris TaxID=40348 RepID=A0A3P7KLA0_STRVU|nr:unnamed protein product [Strongylus vulgaris]